MATKIIKTTFQFRRDTAANWELNKAIVPSAGEPCYDLDNKTLRIGDGITSYELLPVIGEVTIETDDKTIVYQDGIIALSGFEGAENGAQLTKGADGNLSWVVPSSETVDGMQTTIGNLSARVTTNENDIATLNGDGEGSVIKTVDDAINTFVENVTNDSVVNTFKELVDYVAAHAPEAADMAADIAALQESVGDTSVSEQISNANYVQSISINGVALATSNKNVDIPVGQNSLGVVKQSNEITVADDGTLGVGEISFDKIIEGNDIIIFDGGNATDLIS